MPVIGLGSWITFNVGTDPVLRDASAEVIAAFVAEGGTARSGEVPTNTMGGLKARGNPLGATGLYQIGEVALQLQGRAGPCQVEGAEVGLASSLGGLGSTCAVTILRGGLR